MFLTFFISFKFNKLVSASLFFILHFNPKKAGGTESAPLDVSRDNFVGEKLSWLLTLFL